MALHTFGSTSTTALSALKFEASNVLSPADLAAIANSIVGDGRFAATNPTGILATGTTHSNTTLDTLVAVAGGPLASIGIGFLVLGVGIPPGTFVAGKPTSTSVTLSQAATAGSAGTKIAIIPPDGVSGRLSFNGQLEIPGRGLLKVLPGDVVAIDNTGWPILVSAAAIAYGGSLWDFT